jgi:Na+/citrate or Na+/malate symporter
MLHLKSQPFPDWEQRHHNAKFAQIATRIGGAITITAILAILDYQK